MKKIALFPDDRFHWKYVETYLDKINAEVCTFPPDTSHDEITGCGADLLIVGTDRIPSVRSTMRVFKTIVIYENGDGLPEQTRASKKKALFLRWPVSKDQLLGETAAMLGISPRKDFRVLVRIFSPDAEHGVMGKSIDFSLTGMSFTAEKHYSFGHRVSISLSIPNGTGKLALDGRVTRNWINESDGAREYGVEFRDLSRETAQALKEFILG
jgi:hypothetical protein